MLAAIGALLNWQKLAGLAMQGLTLALKYWKEILVILLISVVFYQNTSETRWALWADTIPYLQAQIDEQAEAIKTITEANEHLSDAINTTNEQIQEWKVVSERLEQQNMLLEGELKGLRSVTVKEVKEILRGPTPESCEAAIQYLRDSIPGLDFN